MAAAALLAADEVSHEWDFSEEPPVLRIPGVFSTTSVFFFVAEPFLYLFQPGALVKVRCPESLGGFVVDHGKLKGEQSSSLFVYAPKGEKNLWRNHDGDPVDLLALDQQHFGDLQGEKLALPLRQFFSSDRRHMDAAPFLTLPKLLSFLKKTEGPLAGSMHREDRGWIFTVQAGARTFSALAQPSGFDFEKAES